MNQQDDWKQKMHGIFETCSNELKRTTEIGKKMFSASRTSSNLKDAYEQLGQLIEKEMDEGSLKWENSRMVELLAQIKACKSDLKILESEVNNIRFSPAPNVVKTNDSEEPTVTKDELKP